MNKLLSFFASLFLTVSITSAQDSLFIFKMNSKKVIYHGINNTINLKSSIPHSEYIVSCERCRSFEITDDSTTYSIKSKPGSYVKLNVLSVKDSNEVIYSEEFKVIMIPEPILFLGGKKNGYKIAKELDILSAQYSSNFNLNDIKSSFKIISWKISIDGKEFLGTGATITDEVKDYMASTENLKYISVIADVKRPDGNRSRIGGTWSL